MYTMQSRMNHRCAEANTGTTVGGVKTAIADNRIAECHGVADAGDAEGGFRRCEALPKV